jgi:predicted nucleic acid-binding protein
LGRIGSFYCQRPDFIDSAHRLALALTYERAASRIVTTDEVLAEYLTFFSAALGTVRREVAESVQGILATPVIGVIPQSRASFLAGLELYTARPEKGYSLLDCISMRTMRQEGLSEVLTNDRHFAQEGFARCSGICEKSPFMPRNQARPRSRTRRQVNWCGGRSLA